MIIKWLYRIWCRHISARLTYIDLVDQVSLLSPCTLQFIIWPTFSICCEQRLANTRTAVAALKSKFIADFQLVDSQKVGREMKLRVRRVKPFARSDYGRMKYMRSRAPK
jgi:hypothetical protein